MKIGLDMFTMQKCISSLYSKVQDHTTKFFLGEYLYKYISHFLPSLFW